MAYLKIFIFHNHVSQFFIINIYQFSSVQFCRSVVSNSLWPHELQHARPPCPSPSPRVYSNSCPSSRWCHPAISSSVIPFSSCPNPSQHQSLFQWVNTSQEVAKVLEFQLQYQLFYLLDDCLNVCCYVFQGLGQQVTRLWVAGVSLWLACLCGVTARDSHCCIYWETGGSDAGKFSISPSFFVVFSGIVP